MALNPRAWIAELIATFALVFFGPVTVTLSVVVLNQGLTPAGLIAIALAHGLAITLMIYAIGHVSGGHINPAVTIPMMILRKIDGTNGVMYIVSQLIGAVLAALAHRAVLPQGAKISYALNQPGQGISQGTAFLAEVILTFFLVFVIFGVAVHRKAPPGWAGFAIGMTVALDHFAGVPISGASMNPARTFGPALVAMNWNAHAIYWIGPILGGIIAALIYQYVIMSESDRA